MLRRDICLLSSYCKMKYYTLWEIHFIRLTNNSDFLVLCHLNDPITVQWWQYIYSIGPLIKGVVRSKNSHGYVEVDAWERHCFYPIKIWLKCAPFRGFWRLFSIGQTFNCVVLKSTQNNADILENLSEYANE